MAIVEMKRLTLLAPKADRDKLLRALQRLGCVEITAPQADEAAFAETQATGAEQTAEQAQATLEAQSRLMAVVERLEGFERRRGEIKGMEARAQAGIAQYTPWEALDEAPQRALAPGRDIRYLAGTLPSRGLSRLEDALGALSYAALTVIGNDRENVCVVIAMHACVEGEVRAATEQADFTQETFAALQGDTPAQYIARQQAQLRDIDIERQEMQKQLAGMADDIGGLKILYELLDQQLRRQQAAQKFAVTETTFLLQGWVPAPRAEKAEQKIRRLSPVCALELRDPETEEQPPVQLHNNRFASVFEPVVEGYSLPDYRGIDPTAVMAPFYACLFGMMVSDAGYGLVMALLIPIFMKIKKIKFQNAKMLYLLTYGGIATIIWGLIYNTVFGFNPLPRSLWLLDSVGDSLPVMGVCIGVGALHLFAGLGVGAYMNIKRGKPWSALFDQGFWIILLVGVGVMMLVPGGATIGKFMMIGGAVGILLTAGRDKPTVVGKLMGGFGALYGISSWLGDILSYMRLFGMGLATGVIGMVANMLAGLLMTNPIGYVLGVLLLVAVHAFNAFINVLGAYVHSCRLAYIEFFSKFYEDGGVEFKPLTRTPRYVAIGTEAENK